MGIVAKQSILNTIITYVGFLFGAVNTLFLFTNILSEDYYGLTTYMLSASNLLWPLLVFGLQNTLIKFYSSYTNELDRSRFISWILLVPIALVTIVLLVYIACFDQISAYFNESNPIIKEYVWIILLLGFTNAYFELFFAWTKVHLQSVKGNLLKELFHRIAISILLLIVYFKGITPQQFIYSLIGIYLLRTLLMKWIAFSLKRPSFNLGKLPNTKSVINYSVLILIAATVAVFLIDLDKVMIAKYRPISEVALYGICAYMASVIGVPTRAMLQITNPLTAQLLSKKDFLGLSELNKKSSVTSLVITGFVALLVVCNVHSLFDMIPAPYILYIEIIFLLGIVKLFDAAVGITNSIVFNSDSYKWILFFGVGILGIAYFFNTKFIPTEGIVGAAFATFLAYVLYNIAKLIFVFVQFKIHPFSSKTLYLLGIIIVLWLVFYFWQLGNLHPALSIVIKGITISVVYMGVIYFTRLSPEINLVINRFFKFKLR